MGLSTLGIFHTIIGVIAIGAAVWSLVKSGKINLAANSGKIYFFGTVITSVTALGLSRNGGFNAGHIFSLFILALVLVAYFLHHKRSGSKTARYAENLLLSLSLLLSMVPTVNETLTRVPLGHPLAAGPTDPLIAKTLLVFFILFVAGSVYQFIKQRQINRAN